MKDKFGSIKAELLVGPGFSGRVRVWAGFGPKVDKNFGLNSGLRRIVLFVLRVQKNDQNNLAILLNFLYLTQLSGFFGHDLDFKLVFGFGPGSGLQFRVRAGFGPGSGLNLSARLLFWIKAIIKLLPTDNGHIQFRVKVLYLFGFNKKFCWPSSANVSNIENLSEEFIISKKRNSTDYKNIQ